MKATLVSDLLTPCSALEYIAAIRGGLETLMGVTPTKEHIAVLTAQSALESGRWKSMHRNNPGNIKAGESYEYLYTSYRCNEVIGGKVVWFDPPHPQCNFRAFLDLETGVLDYLRFLSERKRYALAWEVAKNGTPLAFVQALKTAGYFTADEQPYARAVASLCREYLPLMAELNSRDTEPAGIPDEDICAGAACVAPDPERWIDAELRVMAQRAIELSQAGLEEARRAERDRNMASE